MGFIKELFSSPIIREDGSIIDCGLPHPIPPTWGPGAPDAPPDARFTSPTGQSLILESTSIHELAQGIGIWASFLSYPQLRESRHTTPSRMYILRTPVDWDAKRYGLSLWNAADADDAHKRAEVLENNMQLVKSTIDTRLMKEVFDRLGANPQSHKIISEKIMPLQAARYGVELHIEEIANTS